MWVCGRACIASGAFGGFEFPMSSEPFDCPIVAVRLLKFSKMGFARGGSRWVRGVTPPDTPRCARGGTQRAAWTPTRKGHRALNAARAA